MSDVALMLGVLLSGLVAGGLVALIKDALDS